jgi:hypothetical protein
MIIRQQSVDFFILPLKVNKKSLVSGKNTGLEFPATSALK